MWVSGQPHAPVALQLGKESTVPIKQKPGWIWSCRRSDKFLAPAGIQTRIYLHRALHDLYRNRNNILPSAYKIYFIQLYRKHTVLFEVV